MLVVVSLCDVVPVDALGAPSVGLSVHKVLLLRARGGDVDVLLLLCAVLLYARGGWCWSCCCCC